MEKPNKKAPLGQGGRWAALVGSLMGEGHDKESASAIAASIGRKKYGAKKFNKLAAKGK